MSDKPATTPHPTSPLYFRQLSDSRLFFLRLERIRLANDRVL